MHLLKSPFLFSISFLQAGSIEGQVVEMGLTTTTLLNAEKFPVFVPNSMFSSQVGLFSPPFYSSSLFCNSSCSVSVSALGCTSHCS